MFALFGLLSLVGCSADHFLQPRDSIQSVSSDFSRSMYMTTGSDGKFHSKVEEVRDHIVDGSHGHHSVRSATACIDGICKEAVLQGGPLPASAQEQSHTEGDSPSQGPQLGHWGDLVERIGSVPVLGVGPADAFGHVDDEMRGVGDAAVDLPLQPSAGLVFGDLLGHADDVNDAKDGEADSRSLSQSRSISRSFTFSNMNGEDHAHESVTRCQNGKCETKTRSTEPKEGSYAADGKLMKMDKNEDMMKV